jgi:hypothetical protein
MEKLFWHTEKRRVKDLIPFEMNPRKLNSDQVKQLKESIEKFNLVEIPVIDLDNKIIAGHQRCTILCMLDRGNEMIEVRVPNRKLTSDEFMEYNIRSNKNIGEWDFNVLANFNIELLKISGFTQNELNISFGLDLDNFGEKNKEILANTISDISTLTLKFSNKKYLEILEGFNRAKRDLVAETNEEVLAMLLENYV